MRRILLIGQRVMKQLIGDKRFLAISIIAPLVIIYFLKIVFDTFQNPSILERLLPDAGFIVYFISFILCAILLVQERNRGTLARLFVSGFKKYELIGGYTLGYLTLATVQSVVVMTELILLFDLHYSAATVASFFLVFWVLAMVSVLLGIFVSTFARHEAQVFPFIPLIILPSVFFAGVIIDPEKLPRWAFWLGHIFPSFYANKVLLELVKPDGLLVNQWPNFIYLVLCGLILLILSSATIRDVE